MSTKDGVICPFCSGADPRWPDKYMQPKTSKGRPSERYRNLVAVTCLGCGARWTREGGVWVPGEKKVEPC